MSSPLLTTALNALIHSAPGGSGVLPRALSGVVSGSSFKLPELKFDPAALEPFISGEIMKVRCINVMAHIVGVHLHVACRLPR